MADPLSAYVHRSTLVDNTGLQSEGVNKVAIYYWDTSSLAWVKATGGSVPGANVNVTNFPIGQKTMAASMPVVLASDQTTVSTANGTTLATDKTILTKSIVTGASTLVGNPFTDVKVTPDGGICTNQNILVNAGCSSTTNLAAGATFTGVPDLNIFASGIQVLLDADQNCTVFVDQSGNGTNWDVVDSYDYFASRKNFGITVMCVGVFYRVRVTNIGIATTTSFRLQTISVPFVSPLPRSLTASGDFRVAVNSVGDHYGVQQYLAPNGEVVAVPLYKLIGDVFTGTTIDPNFWVTTLGTGGTANITGGQLVVDTGTTANNAVEITSVRTARFTGLAPNKLRIVVQLPDTGIANNLRHWGMGVMSGGGLGTGCAFQMNNTNFELVMAKSGVITTIANGTFNGQYGLSFNPGLVSHFYEIIYQPRQVIWLADNKIIHTFSASASPWTDELHLPIHIGNVNSGGLAQSVTMAVRIATTARFGVPEMQSTSAFLQRTTVDIAQNLKNTPGNLHGITISGVANNAVVTLYNNTTATGAVIWTSGAMSNNTFPFDLQMNRIPFSVGLSVGITGAACSALIKYE